ncbi:MAG: protein kinase [Planctomycetales bacterium]|nr:protein kinase [Planctomycetales bacterium]
MKDGEVERTSTADVSHIGPYVIESEIGRGAHGVVYQARHSQIPERIVALKVVRNRGQMDRLLLEPELLSQLDHSSIVKVLDYFTDNNCLVIALEYIDGEDLQTYWMRRNRLSSNQVWEFLLQMSSALQHSHAAGILHRDIKFSNVIVEHDNDRQRFVLTDFGISRLAQGIQSVQEKGGTYQFMAPEQLRGRPVEQSDLWSLGVMAYALVCGKLPFTGQTVESLSEQILFAVPPPPGSRVNGSIDEQLENVILSLLEKPLASRIESASRLFEISSAALRNRYQPSGSTGSIESRTGATANTFDQRIRRGIRWNTAAFWVMAILLMVPFGPVVGALALAGVLCFLIGQSANVPFKRWTTTTASFVLLALAFFLQSSPLLPPPLGSPFEQFGKALSMQMQMVLFSGLVVYNLSIGPLAVHFFTRSRKLRREISLRVSLREGFGSRQAYVGHLDLLIEAFPDDSYLQQKYVEALLSHHRYSDAAAEALLILEEDPYDFAANLLLAHCYLESAAHLQCAAICDQYLAISGHCFEFHELRTRCNSAAAIAGELS